MRPRPLIRAATKSLLGQITFQSRTLLAASIEQEHSRRPDRIEAVEPCRVLFDVGFYWEEVFANELGQCSDLPMTQHPAEHRLLRLEPR